MKKIAFLFCVFILVIIGYLFSALYSTHQIHKGIYYNDKALIKEYVEWKEVRDSLKNYLNTKLLIETQKKEEFKDFGGLEVLIAGFVSKIVDSILDTYVNSEGLSMLLKENQIAKKLPKPGFDTLLGGVKIIEFKNHSSFRIKHIVEKQEIFLLFQRTGIDWKITQLGLSDDMLEDLKKSNPILNKNITKKEKNNKTTKQF